MARKNISKYKLKSFEIKLYNVFLKVTNIDWHSIHIHIVRNFFYLS